MTSRHDLYKIKTIAAMTGFSPTLLRAWERRYALLKPTRTDTGHRLYTSEDLRVLTQVRRLIGDGRTIGEVVKLGRDQLLQQSALESEKEYPQLERLCQQLVEAALALQESTVQHILDQLFGLVSPALALQYAVSPAAHRIGSLWQQQRATVASEHMLSACLSARLHQLLRLPVGAQQGPPVLCCGYPGETHDMGSMMLAYLLRQWGYDVCYLGPALPFADLSAAIRMKQARWVFVSVATAELLEQHRAEFIQLLKEHPKGVRFYLGGLGVLPEEESELKQLGVELWSAHRWVGELQEHLSKSAAAGKPQRGAPGPARTLSPGSD